MPARNLAMIHRDINRLEGHCRRVRAEACRTGGAGAGCGQQAAQVNAAYQAYVDAIAKGKGADRARYGVRALRRAAPVARLALLTVPGAGATVHAMPPRGGTTDDMMRVRGTCCRFIEPIPAPRVSARTRSPSSKCGRSPPEKETARRDRAARTAGRPRSLRRPAWSRPIRTSCTAARWCAPCSVRARGSTGSSFPIATTRPP